MDPISDKTRTNFRDTAKQLYAQGVDAVMHIHAETVLQYEARLEQAEAALGEAEKALLADAAHWEELGRKIEKEAMFVAVDYMSNAVIVKRCIAILREYLPAEVCKQAREEHP